MAIFDAYLQEHALTLNARRCPYPKASDRAAWEALPCREALLRWGDEALKGYPARPATAFLAFTRTGDRQADEKPYFARRRLLMGAALAECVEHNGRYLDAVVDGLWCVCEETSWVISAHNGSDHLGARPAKEHPLPDPANPYVDLFSAQTAATVAHVLCLLGGELDSVSPIIVRRARRELQARVIQPFLTRDDFWWMGFIRRDLNNWTPWIVSNAIDTMLLTLTDDGLLREGLARAMRMLDRYLAVMPADGGCDEGAAYWNMAGGSLLDCLESLRFATGADFYAEPLIRNIGAFPLNAHIAGDWYWNFADCDAKPLLDGERLYTYGVRTGNAALADLGARLFSPGIPPRDTPQINRVLQALFTDVPRSSLPPATDRTVLLPALEAFAFERNGLYAAVKGGHNAESHNHNDVGTFLLFVDGEPAVVDAGNMVYTAKTFSAERYTLWNTRSRNHNLPLVGGMEQRAGADARATDLQIGANGVEMELAAAYPPGAHIERYRRSLVNDGAVTLTDTLALSSPLDVQWVFLLRHEPVQSAPGRIVAGNVTIDYDSSLIYGCEEYPVTDARMARSFPGSLWRVTLTSAPATKHEAVFRLTRSCYDV